MSVIDQERKGNPWRFIGSDGYCSVQVKHAAKDSVSEIMWCVQIHDSVASYNKSNRSLRIRLRLIEVGGGKREPHVL